MPLSGQGAVLPPTEMHSSLHDVQQQRFLVDPSLTVAKAKDFSWILHLQLLRQTEADSAVRGWLMLHSVHAL